MRGYGRKRPIPDPPEWTYVDIFVNRDRQYVRRVDRHGLPHLDMKYGPMETMVRDGLDRPGRSPWEWG